MKRPYKKLVIILTISIILLCGFAAMWLLNSVPKTGYTNEVTSYIQKGDFHDGDLILRKGQSIESEIVDIADSKSNFSHIGIVKMVNNQPWIIHASPESTKGDLDPYLFEQLSTFLAFSKSKRFAHYSLKPDYTELGKIATNYAYHEFEEEGTFDHEYNLLNSDRQYCSELVLNAYLASGIRLLTSEQAKITILGKTREIILPSQLTKNRYFTIKHISNF